MNVIHIDESRLDSVSCSKEYLLCRVKRTLCHELSQNEHAEHEYVNRDESQIQNSRTMMRSRELMLNREECLFASGCL